MIPGIVDQARAALKAAPEPLTLEEVAQAANLSLRMATRALDTLQVLEEVTTARRYSKGRRGALPQVFALVAKPAAAQ